MLGTHSSLLNTAVWACLQPFGLTVHIHSHHSSLLDSSCTNSVGVSCSDGLAVFTPFWASPSTSTASVSSVVQRGRHLNNSVFMAGAASGRNRGCGARNSADWRWRVGGHLPPERTKKTK